MENNLFNKEAFRNFILSEKDPAYTIHEIDDENIDLVSEHATAHISIYSLEYEIVTFMIDSDQSEEPLFFLHFELKDEDHAKQLFHEMIDSLKKAGTTTAVKILLSCTSGFTTSFFADKLNSAAKTLGLNYIFSAVAYTDLFKEAQDKDVILLAPQIGYMYQKISDVLKDKKVIQIPTAVFASYNVNEMIDVIKEELDKKETAAEQTEDIVDPEWDSVIAIIAIIHRNGKFEIVYRCADQESPLERGTIIKDAYSITDLEDLLDYLFAKIPRIKGVAIVTPGTVYNGYLTLPSAKIFNYDIVGTFTKKYHRAFILCNDANVTAAGYYANHRDCGDLLVYYQPPGTVIGGAGMIIDGKMHIGKNDSAGEVVNYIKLLNFSEDRFDLSRTPEGIVEYVAKVVTPMILTIGPDTLAIYCDLLTDLDELHQYLLKYLPEHFIPQLDKVANNHWDLFYGGGVQIYNLLHNNPNLEKYRPELKEYWGKESEN